MDSVLSCKNINTFIFDFGSVLIQPMDFLQSLKESDKIPNDYVDEIYNTWMDIERNISEHYDIKKFINIIGHALSPKASIYVPDVLNIIKEKNIPFSFSEKLIKDLKNRGYKVYYLSNWSKWCVDLLKENGNFDICDLFDGGLFSGYTDYKKPYTEFYQLLLDRYDIDPTKSLFFDDNINNITAAKRLNINAVLFNPKNASHTVETIYCYYINIHESVEIFYNELKKELAKSDREGFYFIKPSNDKEELDKSYQLYNAQNSDQKLKADTRSLSLYGMNNYDHYHTLLSKIKKGTKNNDLQGLEYNPHDETIIKEEYDINDFNCDNIDELETKIANAKEFNMHTNDRVIIYPTKDQNELESLYMKYMVLEKDLKAESDHKTEQIFGKNNRDMYSYIKNNIIAPKNDEVEFTHTNDSEEGENDDKESILSNDLPLLTPDEVESLDENYLCFTKEDASIIKAWRESYINMESSNYRELNIQRLNILRKAIYENNTDAIIQCGWIPGIEFNSQNRSKASNIVKNKINSVITEAKSFPVQFDNDGNLIIKNIKKIDFEQEYTNSHRLLMQYDKNKAYDQMKFELAKMQFFITLLEKKIYNNKNKSKDEVKVRARFLNDFKKYLDIVILHERTFNFAQYYEQSPFNDALIKIDKNTLKYGWKALKYIIAQTEIIDNTIEIIIGGEDPIEETAIVTSDNIGKFKIYLRNSLEASKGSAVPFNKHGPSFKVLKGSKVLADVVVPTKLPVDPSNVIIKGVLPASILAFVINFAIKNSGNIRALWDTSRDSKNYESIIKRIERKNPDCTIRINK